MNPFATVLFNVCSAVTVMLCCVGVFGMCVVVVCLPRPMERGDSNFQIFLQNCQFHYRQIESLEHLMCFLLYIILSTTVSFLDLKDYFFYKVSFLCTFPIFSASTLYMCVMCLTSFDGLF